MATLLKGRRVIPLALVLIGIVGVAFAAWRADLQKGGIFTNGQWIDHTIPIGINGTSPKLVKFGTGQFLNANTTSRTLTVTGLLPGDVVNLTANTKPTNASYISSTVVTTNTLVVWYNTDPGTTITLSYVAMRPY